MTGWKTTLLATQWLLMSTAQSAQWDWTLYPDAKPRLWPSYLQAQILPPKEFDHEYDGKLTIIHMIPEDIYKKCRSAITDGGVVATAPLACAQRNYDGPGTCTIWIMTLPALTRFGWDYNFVMRHEIAHCNGYRH